MRLLNISLTPEGCCGKKQEIMHRRILPAVVLCALLTQCHSLKSDCVALQEREQAIAAEQPGDYFIGRRYYVPVTRFWGYMREPGKSWRTAKLVMMDESVVRTPDRGMEPPAKDAIYGTDQNVEYCIRGKYTGKKAYDPSTNQVLPMFRATSYEIRNREPGFLFVPSEEYSEEFVTLRPQIMPKPENCAAAMAE